MIPLRQSNLSKLQRQEFDVLIVGAGINGAVAAAALASRGVSVALIDRGDFASGTSQQSSNLAWGGIKYMESLEFGLVRGLCMSRNRLIRSYPSTVREIRFFTSIDKGFRWHPLMLWLGTWLYWLIGNGFTKVPRLFWRHEIERAEATVDNSRLQGGFEYSDAYLYDNDARFVFNFVRSSITHGGCVANYVEATAATRTNGSWRTTVRDGVDGQQFEIRSRALINAAGPWVDELNRLSGQQTRHRHVLSKGIHLIVDKISSSKRVLAFFADDGRLFFAIPMGTRTCIGTTDSRVDTANVAVTAEERTFVLDNINRRLKLPRPLTEDDVIAERCGVRPLVVTGDDQVGADFLQLSRKHVIETDPGQQQLSIFGGKLTDCINVGEEVCAELQRIGIAIPHPQYRWFGEPEAAVRQQYLHQVRLMNLDALTAPESSEPLSRRYWRRYGAQAFGLLENIRENPTEAEVLIKGTEYTRCELRQARRREMIVRLEDFLRRRSKIALVERAEVIRNAPGLAEACAILFGDAAKQRIDEYFQSSKNTS